MSKKDIINRIKKAGKIAALGLLTNTATPTFAHTPSEPTENKITNTVSPTQSDSLIIAEADTELLVTNKVYTKFDSIPEMLPLFKSLQRNTEYVVDMNEWRKNGNVIVKCANRQNITAPDLTSVMIRRECGYNAPFRLKYTPNSTNNFTIQNDSSEVPLHKYNKEDPTADLKVNPVNINKAQTRCFICQADYVTAQYAIAFMYCSNDSVLQQFASNFIPDTENNRVLANKIKNLLYDDKTNDLKIGAEGTASRVKACTLLRDITTKNIKQARSNKLSNTFVKELTELSKNHFNRLLANEKDFVIAIYPAFNKNNIPASKARNIAKQKKLRDASCLPLGIYGLNTASAVAFGTYSEKTLNESPTISYANKISKVDYLTVPTLRQMAIAGYEGADVLYTTALDKVTEDRAKTQEQIEEMLNLNYVAPNDAIKVPKVTMPPIENKQLDVNIIQKSKRER